MDKAHQDGLFVDKSYFIKDEKQSGIHIWERVIQILAIMIGSWSAGSILIKCLNISADLLIVNLSIVLFSGIMYLLFLIPSLDFVKIFFVVLFYGLYFFSRLPSLANGFYIIENLVIDRLVTCYNYTGYYFEANYFTDGEDTTRLVIIILIPLIILLTLSIVRNRLVSLSNLILFLPVLISILLGVIPGEKYLIAYIVCALYLARSGFSLRLTSKGDYYNLLHKINSRVAVWLSAFCLLLFFVLRLCVPKEEFNNITGLNAMKSDVQTTFLNIRIEDVFSKFSNYKLFEYDASIGGLRGGELGKDGKVEFTNSEQLTIKAPIHSIVEGIYLKGYVGTEYTGDRWKGHTEEDRKQYDRLQKSVFHDKFQPVNQMNQLLNQMIKDSKSYNKDILTQESHVNQSKMTVNYQEANRKYIYAPYYTNYNLLDEVRYEQDLYAKPLEKKDTYEFDYYNNLAFKDSNDTLLNNLKEANKDYVNYEKAYRNYVYQAYTRLPKGLDRVKKEFSKNKNLGGNSISGKIAYVREYLNNNTTYSLEPGKLPEGKDFVEYFLYESKMGYCAHYASAATLMLRSMGIPARYVEGYVVKGVEYINSSYEDEMTTIYTPNGHQEMSTKYIIYKVTDKCAHAWVEVYIDGCGWIPVEFTRGSTIDSNPSLVRDLSDVSSYFNDGERSENISPTNEPTKEEPTITKPAIDHDKNKSDHDKSSDRLAGSKKITKLDTAFIIAFFLLAFTAVCLFIVSRIIKYRRLSNLRNHNKKALFIFAKTGKILSCCKYLPDRKADLEDSEEYVISHCPYIERKAFDSFMKIIKKARFSNESISDYELKELEVFQENLYNEVYKELSFRKRLQLVTALLMQF